MRGLGFKIEAARLRSVFTPHITRKINGPVVLALLHQPDLAVLAVDLRPRQSHDLLDAQRRRQCEALDDRKLGAGRLVEARLLSYHSGLRSRLSFSFNAVFVPI